jgi:NADPH:quinone reductase-like Zn-dependent oxidoreductase
MDQPTDNYALWLKRPSARFEVGPAPYTAAGAGEVVVRVRAVSVNPVDTLHGMLLRLVAPWLRYPAILGGDVAGEVVEVGPGVTRFRPGDRVLGLALGLERSQNRPAEGAFQRFVVLLERMVAPIPDSLPFEQAAVLPLTLATAATGLYQSDHLALSLPSVCAAHRGHAERRETVLVWGGSTSVGSNAIQLASNSGYRVVATASPRNFEYLRSLGAVETVDRHSRATVDELIEDIGCTALAGALAIGRGSLGPSIAVAARTCGPRKVAAAQPGPITRLESTLRGARRRGVTVSGIWGGTLKDNEVGPAVFVDFLPGALAAGSYKAAPPALVVGNGLDRIPEALHMLRAGVSATKLVITL